MIECGEYAKLENLEELTSEIDVGMDIEFILHGTRYNISWRDGRPFICTCPDGSAIFYEDTDTVLGHVIDGRPLRDQWQEMQILFM